MAVHREKEPPSSGKDSFLRKTGAAADVAELEYIIALHQTTLATETSAAAKDMPMDGAEREEMVSALKEETNPNASTGTERVVVVTPQDMQALLRSRYGVEVPLSDLQDWVCCQGFGVGSRSRLDNCSGLDPLHLWACLLIPLLCGRSSDSEQPSHNEQVHYTHNLASFVLPRLLQDCIGIDSSSSTPPLLTTNLLRRMFRHLEIYHVVSTAENDDDLFLEMIRAAASTTTQDEGNDQDAPVLDVETFWRGLTGDLSVWDVYANVSHPFEDSARLRQEHMASSPSDEVSARPPTTKDGTEDAPNNSDQQENVDIGWKLIPMGRTIDLTAGTFYSRAMVVLLYASFLLTYVAYFFRTDFATEYLEPTCPSFESEGSFKTNRAAFFCAVAWAICRFLYITVGMG